MIVRFLNFVIFFNLLAIAKEFHVYVTLIIQSTEKYTELGIIRVRTAFYISMRRTHSPTRARMTNGRFISQ